MTALFSVGFTIMEDEFSFIDDGIILDERDGEECFEDDDEDLEEDPEDLEADRDDDLEADREDDLEDLEADREDLGADREDREDREDVLFEFLRSRKKPTATVPKPAPQYEGIPLELESDPDE